MEVEYEEDNIKFRCQQVAYKFYRKSMAREKIMKATSAMPEKIKRKTLVNELLRHLLNTTHYLPNAKEESTNVTNKYMITMMISGYPEKTRKETVLSKK